MKELRQSFSLSVPTYAEQHLLESIPEEDQAALLPIIKLAFPILEWGSLQSFCPSEVGVICPDVCIKDESACSSSEYSWVQQQEASLGAAFRCGDHVWKRVSAENTLDLSRCTSCKFSENNKLVADGVREATNMPEDSKEESVSLENIKRKASSTCLEDHDVKTKRVQISFHAMADDAQFSRETKMRCSSPERMVATGECSDKLNGTHVPGSAILNMELHKRCHRSNGKQWRCSKIASPGTKYCEVHHKYMKKSRFKKSDTPGKACNLEQKRAAFLKEKQVNVARCHRTDGKLWQCSKQAMSGSLYCENHHNRPKKSKKQLRQLRATSFIKYHPIKMEGKVSKQNEENGFHKTSANRCKDTDGLMQLCEVVVKQSQLKIRGCGSAAVNESEVNQHRVSIGTLEESQDSILTQTSQVEYVPGLVSLPDEQKQDRVEPVLAQQASAHQKKSVDGLGQIFGKMPIKRGSLVMKEVSISDIRHVCGSGHSDAKPQGNEDGGFVQCNRNDGRQWQCSKLSKSGSLYCEHHQKFEQGSNADKLIKVEGRSLEHLPNNETMLANKDRRNPNVASALPELEQSNSIMSQDLSSVKQCQRKDGKGWQCLKDAKRGHNYCLHHLEYLSKRKTRLNKKKNFKSEENGISLSDKQSPAMPSTFDQKESAMEFLNKPSLDGLVCSLAVPMDAVRKHGDAKHNVGAQVIQTQGPLCGSGNLVSSMADTPSVICKLKRVAHTQKAPAILQGSLSVSERLQRQEACTSGSNLIHDTNTPQDISAKETQACVHNDDTQQYQHLRVRSVLCSNNQNGPAAHNSSLNKGSIKEERLPSCDKTSASDNISDADGACDKGHVLHESKQLNGILLQEMSLLKQCQRKDGKYWQCSKSATPGQNYCLHHLAYLRNRRYTSKSCQTHQLSSEDKRALFAGDGPFLCHPVSSSAIPNVLQKGLSARKHLFTSGANLSHDVDMADPVDGIYNGNNIDCSKQASSTTTVVETEASLQESCTLECKSILRQETSDGLCNEIDTSQNIQEDIGSH